MADPNSPRPAPSATGVLGKTPLLHLLVYALEKRLSGTIELVTQDRRSAVILFAGGHPAKARTSEAVDHLGRVLLELGHLTEADLTQSLAELARAKAAGPMLHGRLLVERGIIDPPKLQAGLREQLARKLRYIAALPADTVYAYYEGFDALHDWGAEGDPVDPVPLYWGMLLAYPPWDRVQAALTGVATGWLRLSAGANLERLALGKDERGAAELLRARPLRAAELPEVGHLNERTGQLLVYLLLVTKQVEVVSSSSLTRMPAVRIPTPGPSSVVPRAAAPAAAPAPPPAAPARTATPLPGQGSAPRQVVAPAPASGPQRSVTPTPAPARSLSPSPQPPRSSSRSPPGIRASTPTPSGVRSSTPSPPRSPSKYPSPKPAAPSGPPMPPASLDAELADRWHEILDRSATIDRADYFAMLDLARDARREEVEAAYFALAKKWHPDRLPPELAPVRDACSRVFGRISEAHATLTDEAERARYMQLLAEGSGSPETQATLAKVVDAATSFQKAEVCFRRNDYAQAETFCRKAVDDDPTQPDYHAMLAWLGSLKPENQTPEKTQASIQALERAIAMSDRCEKAYFWRGMLYKRLGKNEAAVRDFRRAAELNPRNIDAVREVRLYHMRGGRRSSGPPAKRSTPAPPKPEEAAPKPGILGRLFKKP
ncbi:MAG: tetratricopeptide repeat protein [Myxococcales bacterium]|nr:tetratricopeptide repeat protein [Myxococcales bacterium]